ncbi:MAG TPA: hypothetical protein VGN32_05580 [Ktedonobacterales bacterium]|jgi:hypothetical protein|nr:hypothetical protein [Ktedonobacterales bacterium]
MRQRVLLRFAIFTQTTEEFGKMEALGATFAHLSAHLTRHWPAASESLPFYPAFRPHSER